MARNLNGRLDRIASKIRHQPRPDAPLSVIDARPSTGKSAAEIEAEIARAIEYWGTVVVIDR